jgi:hypothetical protein
MPRRFRQRPRIVWPTVVTQARRPSLARFLRSLLIGLFAGSLRRSRW